MVLTNYEIINIAGDGNCLFRAINVYITPQFKNGRRTQSGKLCNKKLNQKEENFTDSLRKMVVFNLEQNKDKYNDPIKYDSDNYDSIDDRISKMKLKASYGGDLEINVISQILNLQILIYVPFENNVNSFDMDDNLSDDEELNPFLNNVAIYGKQFKNKCYLKLEEDHYDLIITEEEDKDLENFDSEKQDKIKSCYKTKNKKYRYILPNNKSENVCVNYKMTEVVTKTNEGILMYNLKNYISNQFEELLETNKNCGYEIEENSYFFYDELENVKQIIKENGLQLKNN